MTIAIKTIAYAGLGLALLSGAASAQQGSAPATQSPAVQAPAAAPRPADTQRDDAPVAGANSFTERQAHARITAAGYEQIASLALGQDGVWRGRAMRGGTASDVAMDFRGEIFTGAAARAPASGTRSDAAPATAPRP